MQPCLRDKLKACGVVSGELTTATTQTAWPEEGLSWGQLGDGFCRRSSLMLRPLPVPSDHFGYFQNFSASCTNASLVLTSFSHQWRLDHAGQDATTCVRCDVTELH